MRALLVISLCLLSTFCDAQQWEWGSSYQGSSPKLVTEDLNGNVYIAGSFTGSITLGNITLSSASESRFIAKADPAGVYAWAIATPVNISDIKVFSSNLFIGGNFYGSFVTNGTTYTSVNGDAVVQCYDLSGNNLWTKKTSSPGTENFNSFAVDSSGNICLTGETSGPMNYDGNTIPAGAFILKTDLSGNYVSGIPVSAHCSGRDIETDNAGNIYLLCDYTDTITIAGNTFYASYYGSHFMVKYNPSGTIQWINDLGGNYYTSHRNLTVTRAGEVYISKDQRYDDILLKKYSSSGNLLWMKSYGGSVYDGCSDLGLDADENLYMTGGFWYSASYGGLAASGTENCLYFAKLDSAGNGMWVKAAQPQTGGFVFGSKFTFKNGIQGYLIGAASGGSSLDGHNVSGEFLAKLNTGMLTTISAKEFFESDINIYPNPSPGIFLVSIGGNSEKHLRIHNVKGQLVYEKQFREENIQVDLGKYPKGIYTIEIIADQVKRSKKLILK
ncbi:MAG TPA: T9SS type A sorting domain-containing protein [Bacteroidia bacterium]|jgi:hypothetical protein